MSKCYSFDELIALCNNFIMFTPGNADTHYSVESTAANDAESVLLKDATHWTSLELKFKPLVEVTTI